MSTVNASEVLIQNVPVDLYILMWQALMFEQVCKCSFLNKLPIWYYENVLEIFDQVYKVFVSFSYYYFSNIHRFIFTKCDIWNT